MATYLYCLLRRRPETQAAPPSGIGGAPVRQVEMGEIAAWVSDIASPGVGANKSARADHARVVQDALATGETPLPARVGQLFSSDDALRSDLERRAAELLQALERLSGKVEMTLSVLMDTDVGNDPPPGAALEPPATGREYLEQLRGGLREKERLRGEGERLGRVLRNALSDLVLADEAVEVTGTRRYIIAHLVYRKHCDEWRARASAVVLHGGRTFVSGPLPPYNFVLYNTVEISPTGGVGP